MRNFIVFTAVLVIGSFMTDAAFAARKSAPLKKTEVAKTPEGPAFPADSFVLFDFNSANAMSDLGVRYGKWENNPAITSAYCKLDVSKADRRNAGYSLKMNYSLDAPEEVYNGIWIRFSGGTDFRKFKNICFWVKGDETAGFTDKFKIELKNAAEASAYYIEGVTKNWKLYTIPLDSFNAISNWSDMKELTICFDSQATSKKGTIYLDDIYVAN